LQAYVVGFAFLALGEHLVLIQKTRPAWQAGKWNGVGGKVEKNERPLAAMVREFKEETGALTAKSDWDHFASVVGPDGSIVHFYRGTFAMLQVQTKTDEIVSIAHVNEWLRRSDLVDNLHYLIPMAMDSTLQAASLQYGPSHPSAAVVNG
jgi:8-oxo-dGTP diphosphatase